MKEYRVKVFEDITEWFNLEVQLHREDGPAIIDGSRELYYIDGKNIPPHDSILYKNKEGQFHREDGPAKEYTDGQKEWFINGLRHREDGPAIEYANGDKEWYINGKLHREDGPAIEYTNGYKSYYLFGLMFINGISVEKYIKIKNK
jgi:hypothetical protein